jgi:SNF2 family DNA or RNA helicase
MRSAYLTQQAAKAKRVLLLTGTPSYNRPSDIAPLVNMLHGKDVLPPDPTEFNKQYIHEEKVWPGLLGWALGVKPGTVPVLKNKETLRSLMQGKVDYYQADAGLPRSTIKDVMVEMSPRQKSIYKYVEGDIPWYTRWKIEHDLPPEKHEAQALNSFMTGVRQVSNTPGGFIKNTGPLNAGKLSPKLMKAVGSIEQGLKDNPGGFKSFVYSNFLDSGVLPMKAMLDEKGISSEIIHGGLTPRAKQDLVDSYNAGNIRVLLGTSSATEGLNLKGTRLIQILEPHFNESKVKQAIGRGIRFKSHDHLPEQDRHVMVERYHSTMPKGWLGWLLGKETSADEWMRNRATEKQRLADELSQLMQQASG